MAHPSHPPAAVTRYAELDVLRGIAVGGMVLYHLMFDLAFFYDWNIRYGEGSLLLLRIAVASTFLSLVGVTSVLRAERLKLVRSSLPDVLRVFARRAVHVFAYGFLVSVATYLVDPQDYVRFGILQLIGSSILLAPLVLRLREWNALIGGVILILSPFLQQLVGGVPGLSLALGAPPPGFSTLDYYPLLPWFGVVQIGMAAGSFLYVRWPQTQGMRRVRSASSGSALAPLRWAGKRPLLLYMVHQPVLLVVLTIFLGRPAL